MGDPKEAGFAVRRAVLGDAHVDRSIAAATEFTRDFQELITRYAWGTIWTRPGLDRRTRRLLVLAMTAALGRWEEFRLHVRAALEHGMEPCDLKEMLLQAAVYTGVTVGNTGFHIAAEEIEKHDHPRAQVLWTPAARNPLKSESAMDGALVMIGEVHDLVKNYGDFCAVNHISFNVPTGNDFRFQSEWGRENDHHQDADHRAGPDLRKRARERARPGTRHQKQVAAAFSESYFRIPAWMTS